MAQGFGMWKDLWLNLPLSTGKNRHFSFNRGLSTSPQTIVGNCFVQSDLFPVVGIDVGGDIPHDDSGFLIRFEKILNLADGA